MILISHRGNLKGPDKEKENKPNYLMQAVKKGYDVETDVWFRDGKYFLGHDNPQYEVSVDFLKNQKFWCHAKNQLALAEMLKNNIHCFWHEKDKVTLTSKNYIWAYPGNLLLKRGIDVMPENTKDWKVESYKPSSTGVCSDFIEFIFSNSLKNVG